MEDLKIPWQLKTKLDKATEELIQARRDELQARKEFERARDAFTRTTRQKTIIYASLAESSLPQDMQQVELEAKLDDDSDVVKALSVMYLAQENMLSKQVEVSNLVDILATLRVEARLAAALLMLQHGSEF